MFVQQIVALDRFAGGTQGAFQLFPKMLAEITVCVCDWKECERERFVFFMMKHTVRILIYQLATFRAVSRNVYTAQT